jgi:hypothetical protein
MPGCLYQSKVGAEIDNLTNRDFWQAGRKNPALVKLNKMLLPACQNFRWVKSSSDHLIHGLLGAGGWSS